MYTKMDATLVKAFWKYMTDKYDSKVVDKKDSSFMKLLSCALDTMHIQDKSTFLNSFASTIGKTIYVPFTIGDPSKFSFERQISICAHEHQHIEQWRDNRLTYKIKYLTNKESRARYEAEAYTSNMELHYWYTGEILDTKDLANKLLKYGCGSDEVNLANKILKTNAAKISKGIYVTDAGKKAISWLTANAYEVRIW